MANLDAMNENKKHDRLVFITGGALGVVLGAAIVFFSQHPQIIKYPIEVSQNTIEKVVVKVLGDLKSKNDTLLLKKQKDIKRTTNNKKVITTADSVSLDSASAVQLKSYLPDDNVEIENTAAEETFEIVKKDERLDARLIEATVLDTYKNASNNVRDSLLESASGIQIDKMDKKKIKLMVEFWKSPLNYKGYRLQKNRLVLFGIEPTDEVVIVYSGNAYFIKTTIGYFKLTENDDFRPYERVPEVYAKSLFEL